MHLCLYVLLLFALQGWREGGDKRSSLTPPTKHVCRCIVAICALNVSVAFLRIFLS